MTTLGTVLSRQHQADAAQPSVTLIEDHTWCRKQQGRAVATRLQLKFPLLKGSAMQGLERICNAMAQKSPFLPLVTA